MPRPGHQTITVAIDSAELLRALATRMTELSGKRATLSDAVRLAVQYTNARLTEAHT